MCPALLLTAGVTIRHYLLSLYKIMIERQPSLGALGTVNRATITKLIEPNVTKYLTGSIVQSSIHPGAAAAAEGREMQTQRSQGVCCPRSLGEEVVRLGLAPRLVLCGAQL